MVTYDSYAEHAIQQYEANKCSPLFLQIYFSTFSPEPPTNLHTTRHTCKQDRQISNPTGWNRRWKADELVACTSGAAIGTKSTPPDTLPYRA